MIATSIQIAAIQTCIDTLVSLRDSNDISSPSHYTDAEMEIDELDLPREAELALADHLLELVSCIQRIR